jgi:hypothetical protein
VVSIRTGRSSYITIGLNVVYCKRISIENERGNFDPRVRLLTTAGVFGPILGTVVVDAARSKLVWSHWEKGQTGLQPIFSYEVPKENSHYTLTYDSISTNDACSTTPQTFSKVVAYHGEMTVDPGSYHVFPSDARILP